MGWAQLNEKPRSGCEDNEGTEDEIVESSKQVEIKIEREDKVGDGKGYSEQLEYHKNRFPIDGHTTVLEQPPCEFDEVRQVIDKPK